MRVACYVVPAYMAQLSCKALDACSLPAPHTCVTHNLGDMYPYSSVCWLQARATLVGCVHAPSLCEGFSGLCTAPCIPCKHGVNDVKPVLAYCSFGSQLEHHFAQTQIVLRCVRCRRVTWCH